MEIFCSGSLAGATAQTIIYRMEVRYRYRGDKYCGEVLFWLPGWGHGSDYHLPYGGKIEKSILLTRPCNYDSLERHTGVYRGNSRRNKVRI